MKRRAFLIGVFGAFASLATGAGPATSAAGQIPERAPNSAPSSPVAASDLDEVEIDYMRRRRRRYGRPYRRARRTVNPGRPARGSSSTGASAPPASAPPKLRFQ